VGLLIQSHFTKFLTNEYTLLFTNYTAIKVTNTNAHDYIIESDLYTTLHDQVPIHSAAQAV